MKSELRVRWFTLTAMQSVQGDISSDRRQCHCHQMSCNVEVSTPAWHSVIRGSIIKNLAINVINFVSLVGRGGSVVRAPL